MKKRLLLPVSLLLLLAGCQKPKDYTCICKTSQTSLFGGDTSYYNYYKIHAKKREAEDQCNSHNTKGIVIWGTSTSCTLN